MANPLFNALGGGMPNLPGLGNPAQLKQQLEQFKNQLQGDPRQMVQQLLNSGKMTQQQFNTLQQVTNQIMGMMPK